MAIEESSVVAAASKAAKFWSTRGGFKGYRLNTEKMGRFILCTGRCFQIKLVFAQHKINFSQKLNYHKYAKRGGGILDIILKRQNRFVA
jgi:hydroxymethylglutaryl-CoA reductase